MAIEQSTEIFDSYHVTESRALKDDAVRTTAHLVHCHHKLRWKA